jgi:hypothetical protein
VACETERCVLVKLAAQRASMSARYALTFEQLGSILRRKLLHFLDACLLNYFAELRRRCNARCDRCAYLFKEFFLPGGPADAKHSSRGGRGIVKLMRRVGWDIDCFACLYHTLLSPTGCRNFAIEDDESFLEIMPVWWGPLSGGTTRINSTREAS